MHHHSREKENPIFQLPQRQLWTDASSLLARERSVRSGRIYPQKPSLSWHLVSGKNGVHDSLRQLDATVASSWVLEKLKAEATLVGSRVSLPDALLSTKRSEPSVITSRYTNIFVQNYPITQQHALAPPAAVHFVKTFQLQSKCTKETSFRTTNYKTYFSVGLHAQNMNTEKNSYRHGCWPENW